MYSNNIPNILVPIDIIVNKLCHYITEDTVIDIEFAHAIALCDGYEKYCHLEYGYGNNGELVKLYTLSRWIELQQVAINDKKRKECDEKMHAKQRANLLKQQSIDKAIAFIRENNRPLYNTLGGFELLKMTLEIIQMTNGDESLLDDENNKLLNYLIENNINILFK